MKPKDKGRIKTQRSKVAKSAPNRQADIAAITSKSSPVRQTYDARGIQPPYSDMIGRNMPGIEIAGRMANGILGLNGSAPARAYEIAVGFSNNHPDVIQSVSNAGSVAINS